MVVGIAEDFSSDILLDAELRAIPTSGVYLNSGVHPSVTVKNLLQFLPDSFNGISAYAPGTTYGKYSETRSKSDLVSYNSKTYQSLVGSNTGNQPDASPTEWMETNIESLMLKSMIFRVMDKVQADLNLTKRLVNNQFLYEVGDVEKTLPNDYAGWVFEPKGSDYLSFRINQISIQKSGTTPINLYVVNQGALVDTLQITPANGTVSFADLGYTFSGKGKWYFVIDSTTVLTHSGGVDPLKYDGFLAYTATGIGDTPQGASYSHGTIGNGLGFNISVELDSKVYLDNNLSNYGAFVRACFEYLTFQMFLHNPNNRSNREQRTQMNEEILIAETKSLEADTVARRYYQEKKRAVSSLQKTFDSELDETTDFEIEYATV